MRYLTVILLVFLLAPALVAQDDAEGAKDYPLFTRYPGFYIYLCENQEFAKYDFPVKEDQTQSIEGRYVHIVYSIKEGVKIPGALAVVRNFANAIAKAGGVKVMEYPESGGLTMRMPSGKANTWIQLMVTGGGEQYELYIVEEVSMEQKIESSATELADALASKGSVALHGILFDTGKSTIKPESATTLATVGEVLKNDAALKLEIQGHTDNVGDKQSNLKLSNERAAAVKAYLVKTFSIDAARLTAAGFGDTKPVADNKTEEGRAQNRRVELVKK